MKNIVYSPVGVCSRQIEVDIDNGVIKRVQFTGGCAGNTQAVARLTEGLTVAQAVAKLQGIDCKGKGTSCPDQLCKALLAD